MHNNPTDDVEVRYSHIIKVITDWIDTTNLVVVFISGIIDRHFQRVARGTQDIRILSVAILQDSYAVASQPVGLELTNLLFVTRMFPLNRRGEALGVGFPFTVGAQFHSTGS